MYVAFGLVVASLAPVLTPLGEDLGLSKSRLGAILGTWPAVFIFAAVPCGRLLDRIGLRWALFAGGVLMGLSGVLRGLATGDITLFVAVGIFGLGAPMISNGAPKLVVSWFGESERAKATGIYVTGPVVGQAVAPGRRPTASSFPQWAAVGAACRWCSRRSRVPSASCGWS